jgi:hypothetical protein
MHRSIYLSFDINIAEKYNNKYRACKHLIIFLGNVTRGQKKSLSQPRKPYLLKVKEKIN